MANLVCFYTDNVSTGEVSITSTSYSDVLTLSGLNASKNYIIFFQCETTNESFTTDSNPELIVVRSQSGVSSILSDSYQSISIQPNTADQYFYFSKLQTDSSGSTTFTLKSKKNSSSSSNFKIKTVSILALEIDNLQEYNDYIYTESSNGIEHTEEYQTLVSSNIKETPPTSGQWIIFSQVQSNIKSSSTKAEYVGMWKNKPVSSNVSFGIQEDGNQTLIVTSIESINVSSVLIPTYLYSEEVVETLFNKDLVADTKNSFIIRCRDSIPRLNATLTKSGKIFGIRLEAFNYYKVNSVLTSYLANPSDFNLINSIEVFSPAADQNLSEGGTDITDKTLVFSSSKFIANGGSTGHKKLFVKKTWEKNGGTEYVLEPTNLSNNQFFNSDYASDVFPITFFGFKDYFEEQNPNTIRLYARNYADTSYFSSSIMVALNLTDTRTTEEEEEDERSCKLQPNNYIYKI